MIWWIIYFILALLLTVIVHELGHMIVALLCRVKVEAFCVGFGNPNIKINIRVYDGDIKKSEKTWKFPGLHKTMFGIDFRITPFLLGGYTGLKGETTKTGDGILDARYYKKFLVLIAGVVMNFILACICYWINYKSISTGLFVDWTIMKSIFLQDIDTMLYTMFYFNPNYMLLQLSLLNLFCAITNILPIPALDGGYLWLYLLEKPMGRWFIPFLNVITRLFFWILMIGQFVIIYYIFWR